jgi:hypothetical protein
MRPFLAAVLLLALCACGETATPAQPAAAREPDALMGWFRASSNTARGITGDVTIERGGLVFQSGVIVYTRPLQPRGAGELISRGGDSYAAAALGPGDLTIELRRVTEQTVPDGRVGLCGASRPEYVALAYEARVTNVKVLVFSGEEPPGPDATHSRLCARFAYDAPDGARTREGVVL